VGNGAFERAELSVRTEGQPELRFEAHSEYLEALVEGGVIRLGFTLLVVYGVFTTTTRAYARLRGRSVGWLVLGAFFALVAVAVHSIADFGLHAPTVALLAAAVMGCVSAAANDGEFAPIKKTKTTQSGATVAETDMAPQSREGTTGRNRTAVVLVGPPALAGAMVVGMLAVVLALEYYRALRADTLRKAGIALKYSKDPERFKHRIEILEARVALTPHDGQAFLDLSQAYFDAALNQSPLADFAGNPTARSLAIQGLRASRAARNVSPLLPQSHFRMGVHHGLFAESEPAAVHLSRAKRLLPIDPEVWFAAGAEAESRGDMAAAAADWKTSLTLSYRQLEPILRRSIARGLSVDEIRRTIIPDNPEVLVYAPEILGRLLKWSAEEQRVLARPFLNKAQDVVKDRTNPSVADLVILARVSEQTGDVAEALLAYRKAMAMDDSNEQLRDSFANFLEREEMYQELLPHLEWLKDRGRGGTFIRDRIDAAKHGIVLQQELSR
jgi:tetratricopeptide (TPR) repeat protein